VVFDDWTEARMQTVRTVESTMASITSRIHGEFSERNRPGTGEYGIEAT